jgi:predicted double-glycine peptidase
MATTATIDVTVSDEAIVESSETVILQLTGTDNPSITVNGAADTDTVTIADDDSGQVSIAANIAAAGEPATNGQFTVSQSTTSATDTVVNYAISGTATNGTDYTLLSGSVTVAAGTTTATIDVTVSDDALVESAETVILQLTGTDNPSITVDGAADTDTVTIANDDSGQVSIAANIAAASEPATNGQFTVTQSATSATDTVVSYAISGSATNGTDYTLLSGSVTITAGSTTATVDVTVSDEALVESAETVIVQLTGTDNPSITVNGAADTDTVTITDDDSGQVSIAAKCDFGHRHRGQLRDIRQRHQRHGLHPVKRLGDDYSGQYHGHY